MLPPEVPTVISMSTTVETLGDSERFSPYDPGRDVSEVFDMREYVPGDDIRTIHWKLSSKTDKTVVREFSKPLNYSVTILADFLAAPPEAVETCAVCVANVSKGLLDNGIMHTLIFYDAGSDELCRFHVEDYDGYELAAVRMISSCLNEKYPSTLKRYNLFENSEKNMNAQVLCFSTVADEAEFAAVMSEQPARLFVFSEKRDLSGYANVKYMPVKLSALQTVHIAD